MLSGITSPTRPWFKLATPDPEMMQYGPVKRWLDVVMTRMNDVMNRSNVYQSLPIIYRHLGVFGTAAMAVLEDDEDVIRTHPLPIWKLRPVKLASFVSRYHVSRFLHDCPPDCYAVWPGQRQ